MDPSIPRRRRKNPPALRFYCWALHVFLSLSPFSISLDPSFTPPSKRLTPPRPVSAVFFHSFFISVDSPDQWLCSHSLAIDSPVKDPRLLIVGYSFVIASLQHSHSPKHLHPTPTHSNNTQFKLCSLHTNIAAHVTVMASNNSTFQLKPGEPLPMKTHRSIIIAGVSRWMQWKVRIHFCCEK